MARRKTERMAEKEKHYSGSFAGVLYSMGRVYSGCTKRLISDIHPCYNNYIVL